MNDLPVLDGTKESARDEPTCLWCQERPARESNSFVALVGGATLFDRETEIWSSSEEMEALLELVWHGAHDDGEGADREIYAVAPLVKTWRGGQFRLMFCSTSCLRRFLTSWVDNLEAKIQEQEQREKK